MRITRETPIVLGSASPRRRDLLALASVPFVVRAAGADESPLVGEAPSAYLERIASAKLDAVRAALLRDAAEAHSGGILVADTIVVTPHGDVLGKPKDDEDGLRMLETLAGATHTVRTRFVLAGAGAGNPSAHAQTVTTAVTFRSFAPGEGSRYVANGEGRDKAGGYAAQGAAAAFVERIEGSYTNVVGLPLCEVVLALRALGWLSA